MPLIETPMLEIKKPLHGSMEWLQARHRYKNKCIIGSSEISAIMGANEWDTITDLAVRKLMPVAVNEPNEAMARGNYLEPSLMQYAQDELMMPLPTPKVMYLRGQIIATLDGRGMGGNSNIIVEAKSTTGWALGTEIPASWWWQVQAQMYCTDTEKVTFVVLDKRMRFGLQEVLRSDEAIADMVAQVAIFCDAIDDERLPDDTVLTLPQVGTLYAQAEGTVELDATILDLIFEWEAIKFSLKDLEAQEMAIKDSIADRMRGAEFGTVGGNKVLSYKTQSTSRLDSKALAKAHPTIAAEFTTANSFRVLRTTK